MSDPGIIGNKTRKIVALSVVLIVFVLIVLTAIKVGAGKTMIPQFSAGDYVTFGRYRQSAGETSEPIVWRVLAADDSELFLLSDKILFFAPFDDAASEHSYLQAGFKPPNDIGGVYSGYWPDSTIRAYLNGIDTSDPALHPHIGKDCTEDSFKTDAFTAEEWGALKETELVTAKDWAEDTGEKTSDKVFLLSSSEVVLFFPKYTDRWTQMTVFAKSQLESRYDDIMSYSAYIRGYASWLTRTYYNPHSIADVNAEGGGEEPGHEVGGAGAWISNGIRPAIKLDLDAPNIYASVKPAQTPDPVPLLEEIVIDVGSGNIHRGDTFVGNTVRLEKSPVVPRTVTDGSPMLPFAHICRVALGGTVAYEDETHNLSVRVKGHDLLLRMDNPVMTVDGAEVELSQPPIIFEGCVFAPLDAFEPIVTSIKWFGPNGDQVNIIP